jgi:death-on-curing protein
VNWVWIESAEVEAAHDEMIAIYGGADGVRDLGALEGALGRPPNLAAYGNPDTADLAALYAIGVAKCHAFVEGNKRTAWATARAFLILNGYRVEHQREDVIRLMLNIAEGLIEAEGVAAWFRERMR